MGASHSPRLSSATRARNDHLRTQHLGPEEILACARIELDPGLDFQGVARAIDSVQERMRARIPVEVRIYLEPDLGGPEHGQANLEA